MMLTSWRCLCLPPPQEKRHHITAELGYSETWWRKYDFYFAYCEAAFDIRYIHDYHVTWRKSEQQEAAGTLAYAHPASAGAVSTVVAAAEAGAGWVKQELPTDSFTQVCGNTATHPAGVVRPSNAAPQHSAVCGCQLFDVTTADAGM
jgi:hypothetical protein